MANSNLVELAGNIVASQATQTPMTSEELLQNIRNVYSTLKELDSGVVEGASPAAAEEELRPIVDMKKAFGKKEVICMVCGKGGFKTLARHLSNSHGMKPSDYRKQFGIPRSQVLAAKNYSESRRQMALDRGLADNLQKARQVRMANIEAKKNPTPATPAAAAKPQKPKAPAKAPKAAKPAAKAPKAK